MPRRISRRGFTLVEILIVVTILGILAGVVIASVWKLGEDSSQVVTRSELAKIRRHIEAYAVWSRGYLPDVTEGDGTWGRLVSREFMTAPPMNAWVGPPNGRKVVFGSGPDVANSGTHGWIYSQATGEVWPAGFDASGSPLARP